MYSGDDPYLIPVDEANQEYIGLLANLRIFVGQHLIISDNHLICINRHPLANDLYVKL